MKNEMNEKQVLWMKTAIAAALVLLAAALRILPHPWNFTPIGAMALFSGSAFRERWLRFTFPLLALFAGDAVVGFHKLMPAVYLSFAVSVAVVSFNARKGKDGAMTSEPVEPPPTPPKRRTSPSSWAAPIPTTATAS